MNFLRSSLLPAGSQPFVWTTIALLCLPASVLPAQAQESEPAPPISLELTEPDPLLPAMVVDRPLSDQERTVLSAALDEIRSQAEAALQAGNLAGAFELWNRELRLRRYVGAASEVESLARVGEIAWRESQITEVRLITQRLQQIEQEAQTQAPPDRELLLNIAQAYQTVRAQSQAVALYQKLLLAAEQQQDVAGQTQLLTNLGELYLAWFDYANAADIYQAKLTLARSQNDATAQVETLTTLARIYQDNNQPQEAIAMRQQLVDLYQSRQDLSEIPLLKLAIGTSYEALQRPDLAAASYQEAFAVARSVQQYGYASDALQRLAKLYESLDRPTDALVVYQLLLDVKQQSYDALGMLETYDRMGQLLRAQGNNAQALQAFGRGLQIAQQLNYKVDYFRAQIAAAQS